MTQIQNIKRYLILWFETYNYLRNCKPQIKTTASALNVKTGLGHWIL